MIRFAKQTDAAQILDIYSPIVQHTAVSFEYEIPEVDEFEDRIERISKFYPYLVWEVQREILAFCYATRFRSRAAYDWIAESAIYVSEKVRGQGIGQKLYAKLFECLRAQGVVSVVGVVRPNEASVQFHEALGFKKVGIIPFGGYKLDRWHEAGIWQLILQDPVPTRPRPVQPFPQVSRLIALNV